MALVGAARAEPVGDVNCDGMTNADDVAVLVADIFDDPPSGCVAADVNSDGSEDGADLVALMQALAPPPTPVPLGPVTTFLGLARVDGVPANPLGEVGGVPVYFRNSGFGFKVVIEGKPGPSDLPPGVTTFNVVPGDPSQRPDLQVETSRALGDGSVTVCDGGVPAVNPPDFGPTQAIANVLNDLGCNFSSLSASHVACTQDAFGTPTFVNPATQVQFCMSVERQLAFPNGDTILSVRLRDTVGNLGPLQQLIVRVGSGPPPPTFTPTPTAATPSATPSSTASRTASATPSRTRTPSPRSTRATATPARSGAATSTATRSPTRPPSPSPTISPTTPPASGPVVTFVGVIRADDTVVAPSSTTADGVPVYSRVSGSGFSLVVEGRRGASGQPIGHDEAGQVVASTFDPDVAVFPDLQIEVSQPLGNGSLVVCDDAGPTAGGVPAVDPPDFAATQANINVVNDLACRFTNGTAGSGKYRGRTSPDDACVLFPTGKFGFVADTTTIQFCGFVSKAIEFPPGDTLLTVRLQDTDGNPGPPARMILHVGP